MHGLMCVFFIALIKSSESNKRLNNPNPGDIPTKVNNDYDDVQWPVPYGHIFKEGFGDTGGLKAPIDVLELNIRHPMEPEEAKEVLKITKPENIQFYTQYVKAKGFTNPRDRVFKELGITGPGPEINATQFRWFDLSDLQARNVAKQLFGHPSRRYSDMRRPVSPSPPYKKKLMDFSFLPHNERFMSNINFTTCDEFGNKAYFFPKDIVNLDWVPFYVWSPEKHTTSRIHSFKYATKKLVRTVREIYRKFIKIDWDQPKLLYYGIGQYLLISADKRGLFHALQLIDSPPDKVVEAIPYSQLRLKIEDPYLVMMYCTDYFATVMALVDKEPKTDKEKEEEAMTIGLKGPGWPVSRDLDEERMEEKAKRENEIKKMLNKPINSGEPPKLDEVKEKAPIF